MSKGEPVPSPTRRWQHRVEQAPLWANAARHPTRPNLTYRARAPAPPSYQPHRARGSSWRPSKPTQAAKAAALPEDLIVLGQALRSARCTSLDLEGGKKGHGCLQWTLNLHGHFGQGEGATAESQQFLKEDPWP